MLFLTPVQEQPCAASCASGVVLGVSEEFAILAGCQLQACGSWFCRISSRELQSILDIGWPIQ